MNVQVSLTVGQTIKMTVDVDKFIATYDAEWEDFRGGFPQVPEPTAADCISFLRESIDEMGFVDFEQDAETAHWASDIRAENEDFIVEVTT